MSYIGHPLLGDGLYNSNTDNFDLIKRQALHSFKMEFVHPVTQNKVCLEANFPNDMKKLIFPI